MAITYDNPEVNAMGVSPIDRSRTNGEIQPQNTLAQRIQAERLQQLQKQPSYFNSNMKFADSATYGSETVNPERSLNKSKYDSKINWNIDPLDSNDIGDKRAEAQGTWGRLKDATMNNITILGTSLASDVVSLTGGLLSAAIQGDISKMWDNKVTNALNDYQRDKLNERQIYRGQDYENKSFMGKLSSGIFWADLWQNAGYMEGMLIPGMAVGKLAQATKLLAKAPQLTKVGTNLIAAIGEASMESLNQKKDSEKDLYAKADRTFREKLANAQNWSEKSTLYDEYGKDLNLIQDDIVKIGNRTFGGNVALLTATGTIEFGDFVSRGYAESHKLLQQIARDASGGAISRSTFNAAMRGLGKTAINFGAEGFEEFAQRSLASGAANTKKANSFLSKYQDEYNVELADNYLTAVWQGLKSDFFNEEAWLEFMSGALMGGIGIPGSHNGAIANIRDNVRETKKEQELANQINAFEAENSWRDQSKQNKFAESYLDYLIRNAGINNVQNKALIDRDKKAFVDARVEKVLNAAYLYDNTGEIDEFKKKMEWYSHIDSEEELQNLIKQTQEVETDENGNVTKEEKASPFKDMSLQEVNQLLKETNDFYAGIIDDFIEGKRFIDDYSRGKLDDDTLKRGAASYAQSKNFKKRSGEMYKDINEGLSKYRNSIIEPDDESKDGKFLNSLFDSIKDLSEDDIIPTFSSTKIRASIIALGEYVNRNSTTIDNEAIKNVIEPMVDLVKISMSYNDANEEVNSILKNAEKEQSKTQKILSRIKNIKKNYLVKKHANRLMNIADSIILDEELKKLPNDIREDVIDYLRNNGNETIKKIFADRDSWDNASRAIMKVIDSYNEELFPVSKKEADDKYGKENVDKVIGWLKDAFANSVSKEEVFNKLDNNLKIENDAIVNEKDKDAVLKKADDLKNTKAFVDEVKNKINNYTNEETKVSNKKKKAESKKKYEGPEDEEDKEISSKTSKIEIPEYIPSIWNTKLKNITFLKDKLKTLKEKGVNGLSRAEILMITKKDPTGEKTIKFLEDLINNNEIENKEENTTNDGVDGDLLEGDKKTDIKKVSQTQNNNFGTDNKKDDLTSDEGPNTALSIGISKYNHEEAKKGNLVIYDENNPIYKLLEDYGAYDFVDNGYLWEYIKYCNNNSININSIINYIKTSVEYPNKETGEVEIHPVYLLTIEADNYFFNKINTKKVDIDGSNYQVIGMLAYNTNNQKSIEEYSKIAKLIDNTDDCGEVGVGEFKKSKLTNGVSNINAGRLVYNKDLNNNGLNILLKDIPDDDFEIGVYDYENKLFTDSSVVKENLVEPVETSRTPGTVYLFVKCADGKYYPRQIRSKKFVKSELNQNDLENDIFIKKIKENIKLMCDTSLTKGTRAEHKNALQRFISFDTDKYKIDDLIGFDQDKYEKNYVVIDGEYFNPEEDGVVDKIFDKIINIKDLKLTPRIHIGGNTDYDYLKSLLKQSTVINTDVKLKSIDCNFELFTTDKDGKINIDKTINSSFNKRVKIPVLNNSLFSFNPQQITEIKTKLKGIIPYSIFNISNIRVENDVDGKDDTYRFFIDGSMLDESTPLFRALNFIYNSILEAKGFNDNYFSFDNENKILFKSSLNSNNTYSLSVGNDAEEEYNKLKKEEEEIEKAKDAEKLNTEANPDEFEPMTPENTTNIVQEGIENENRVKELGSGDDYGYVSPLDEPKSDAEKNAEDCGPVSPLK